MARLGTSFDASEHDTTQSDYPELPNGIYKFQATASDVTPTKDGTGTILKATTEVTEPEEYRGRKLFLNFNLENKNPQATEIGQRQFASLCRAVELSNVDDSEELHYREFTAKVGLGKPSKDGQYPARAEIKRYYFPDEGDIPEPAVDDVQPTPAPKPANDNRPATSARPAATARPAAAQPAGARPWGKK